MAVICNLPGDEEVIAYLLSRLDSEYDSLVDAISTRESQISFSDVYAHFVIHETRI